MTQILVREDAPKLPQRTTNAFLAGQTLRLQLLQFLLWAGMIHRSTLRHVQKADPRRTIHHVSMGDIEATTAHVLPGPLQDQTLAK